MSTTAILTGFITSLAATVVALLTAMLFAHRHRVRAHITTVCVMLGLLLITLGFAEALGTRYEFEATSRSIHLPIAVATAGVLFLPLGAGLQVWRGKVAVRTHKRLVGLWLTFVVAALGTGIWMLAEATRTV